MTGAIYAIFMASGATALVYEIIWARWLGLVFGNTTLAVSIVLSGFMAGLALGSWLAGRRLPRIRNPLGAYAAMELGIGAFAFVFPSMSGALDRVFAALVSSEELTPYGVGVRATLTLAVLLVPTTLMGATLPLLTDVLRRSRSQGGAWRVGLLYAANTFGAAAGVFASSFLLIELLGVRGTTWIAASLNLGVAGVAFAFARALPFESSDADAVRTAPLGSDGRLALAVITATGALALGSEVLWTRTMETLVGSSTYAFATILILYLIGIAVGSSLMAVVVNRLTDLRLWLIALPIGMGVWTMVAVWIFMHFTENMESYRLKILPLSVILVHYVKVVSLLMPLSLLSGACFPLATRMMDPSKDAHGSLVATAYAWNTVGALLGSLIAGFLIAPRTDFIQGLYVMAFLHACVPLAAVALSTLTWATAAVGVVSILLAGLSAAALGGNSTMVEIVERMHPGWEVRFNKPGLQGVTTVIARQGEPMGSMLLVNGRGMTQKSTVTKMMAHLPLLLHPHPVDTLVICFGMGTTYRSAVAHGGNVTVVELVAEVVEALDYFYEDADRVRAYPRGRIVVNDGRNFLKLTPKTFDVITIDPPPPIDAAGVNNLYSREFLELARAHLKPGGIMAGWIPLPGTLAGVETQEEVVRLVTTFSDVFAYAYAYPGVARSGIHVLGSDQPITVSIESIRERLAIPAIANDLNERETVPLSTFQAITALSKEAQAPPPLTDDDPGLEFYLLRALRAGEAKVHP
jgi:spermidine synthase